MEEEKGLAVTNIEIIQVKDKIQNINEKNISDCIKNATITKKLSEDETIMLNIHYVTDLKKLEEKYNVNIISPESLEEKDKEGNYINEKQMNLVSLMIIEALNKITKKD